MYTFDLLEINKTLEVSCFGTKTLYPITPSERADVFCDFGNNTQKIVFPNLCGSDFRGFKYKKPSNSLAFLSYETNPVRGNGESVYIQSAVGHRNRGIFINPENFIDTCALFSAKRLIKGDWVNWYDEYQKPNISELYSHFSYDSLVFSIFNIKSSQYGFKLSTDLGDFRITNEFFWMSRDRMKELADNMGYDELFNDARTDSDRHVNKLFFGEKLIYDKLSIDAKTVLDKATELLELSMEMRQVMANNENHLNSWDAGYAQLKLVWKEYFPEQFKEFRQLYKNMEDRMRPLVYELGFLMK